MPPIARETIIALDPLLHGVAARDLHKMVMRMIDADDLDAQRPRADAGVLWRRDNATLTVRVRPDITLDVPARLGCVVIARDIAETAPGDTVAINVLCNRQYTPRVPIPPEVRALAHSASGAALRPARMVPVGPESLDEWAGKRLARAGVTVTEYRAEVADDVTLDNHRTRQRVPAARIRATVAGGGATNALLTRGLGRAKSYGLGLVVRTDLNN